MTLSCLHSICHVSSIQCSRSVHSGELRGAAEQGAEAKFVQFVRLVERADREAAGCSVPGQRRHRQRSHQQQRLQQQHKSQHVRHSNKRSQFEHRQHLRRRGEIAIRRFAGEFFYSLSLDCSSTLCHSKGISFSTSAERINQIISLFRVYSGEQTMCALLCCGPCFDSSYLLTEDGVIYRWLDALLTSRDDKVSWAEMKMANPFRYQRSDKNNRINQSGNCVSLRLLRCTIWRRTQLCCCSKRIQILASSSIG